MKWHTERRDIENIIRCTDLRQSKIIPSSSDHPTAKPVELMHIFIMNHSLPGEIVLDPFMGSGTTLRAAKDLQRRAIGIEISEKYCRIAVDRLRQEVLDFS